MRAGPASVRRVLARPSLAVGAMQKLILVSILFANVFIPFRAARDPKPRRGLRKALVWMSLFDLAYLFALTVLYPRL
jgi:hypothetical protein